MTGLVTDAQALVFRSEAGDRHMLRDMRYFMVMRMLRAQPAPC
jgi:hypothetical protein